MKNIVSIFLLISSLTCLNAQTESYTQVSKDQMEKSMSKENSEPDTKTQKLLSHLRVQKHISNYLVYPEKMELNGIEGTVMLRFKVEASGKVIETTVERYSHDEFRNVVKDLFDSKPIRSLESSDSSYVIQVPVNFRL